MVFSQQRHIFCEEINNEEGIHENINDTEGTI